jgi:hypothetical protein
MIQAKHPSELSSQNCISPERVDNCVLLFFEFTDIICPDPPLGDLASERPPTATKG